LAEQAAQYGEHREYDEDVEQDLGDRCGACGNAPETQKCGNDRNHEKYDGVVKHGILLFSTYPTSMPGTCIRMPPLSVLIEEFLYFTFGLFACTTIALLHQARKLLSIAIDAGQLIVGDIAPHGLRLAGQLLPLTFDSIFVHGLAPCFPAAGEAPPPSLSCPLTKAVGLGITVNDP